MKTKLTYLALLLMWSLSNLAAQFNTNDYIKFLEQSEDISAQQLMDMHPTGLFEKKADININFALYLDQISQKYGLTEDEIDLISKHGFVVTERLQKGSFGHQFEDIYHKDLPLFISSDAILHAFHASYDKILKNTELSVLIDKLKVLLNSLHNNFPALRSRLSTQADFESYLKDFDIYLTVAKKLLVDSAEPYYEENSTQLKQLINDIESEDLVERPLFSETPRKIDFSQFKPRGHYDDEYHPELANYFRTMMWFGRVELYLIAPQTLVKIPIQDVQRQIIISALLIELIEQSNQRELFDEIEYIIGTFVGEQDNVTLPQLEAVLAEAEITGIDQLLDTLVVKNFQDILRTKSYSEQRILSQILIHDPLSPDKIEPASAFMPFGQRFVIDSYVTGNVVYDRTINKDGPPRMLPSTLDILFSLGNDASAQLLKDELVIYNYSENLAALRYLIDSYEHEFWNSSIYNLWLNSIRSLNPPQDRSNLPPFMQTAAWWQQKMNSQLSSWTELRHDNLLYAKQSYTGGIVCSYPYIFVEPIPVFFESMSLLAMNTLVKLESISSFDEWTINSFQEYFTNFSGVTDTLTNIARKELEGKHLTNEEEEFLKRFLFNNPEQICGAPTHIGWFPELFYNDFDQDEFHKEDYLVADYHTAPTDESGAVVGWVKHAGTGPIDLAIIIAKNADNQDIAYVGPVSSYYEYTTTNFQRLTDSEWKESHLMQNGVRPNWTNIYLANKDGSSKEEGVQLLTDEDNTTTRPTIPNESLVAQNYPNPFNPSTIIHFTIPQSHANNKFKLRVYNIQGELINELLSKELPAGTYLTRWNGDNKFGRAVSSGIYFYEIKSAGSKFVGKMNLIR